MGTFLFDKIVFGPVKSRRLGISLGINLLPVDAKYCNYDCIYCECGLNEENPIAGKKLPTRIEVYNALTQKLNEMHKERVLPDVITFAGNGEPTMHPSFPEIIDDTIALRNKYSPKTKISVLSNSSMLHRDAVVSALKKVDQNIIKLDSGNISSINSINQPSKQVNLKNWVESVKKFNGGFILQTMFVRGEIKETMIDNTTEDDLSPWLEILKETAPQMVMIYTIDRDAPYKSLKKVPKYDLEKIAARVIELGISVQVSG